MLTLENHLLMDTNVHNSGIGAVLSQLGDDDCEHVIAYGSRLLNVSFLMSWGSSA